MKNDDSLLGGGGYPLRVFAAQLTVSVVVWAFAVAFLARRRAILLHRMSAVPRARRVGIALGALLGSVILLALGMGALALGGLTATGLTWWGWPTITLAGAGFVVLQTVGLVPLMLNAVTGDPPRPSDSEDSRRP